MTPQKTNNQQFSVLFQRLSEQLNDRHELYKLANIIDWSLIESEMVNDFRPNFNGGQPPKPTRLMVGLMLLQNLYGLSDEELVRTWVENPYWQYFCGYDFFQWKMPIDPSSMTRWRKRMGKEKLEKILQLTVNTAVKVNMVKPSDMTDITVDTTVMEKNIKYPTDSHLIQKSREQLVELAMQAGIELRQNYNKTMPRLETEAIKKFHSRKYEQGNKLVKKMKTYLGRVVRDIERKISDMESAPQKLVEALAKARKILAQERNSKGKIYSLHETAVECISKGKAHKQYEFGCKVSLAIIHGKSKGLVLSSMALAGNLHDSKTLQAAIDDVENNTDIEVDKVFCDRGYRGHGIKDCAVYISGMRRGITRSLKNKIKRKQAIEPHIGHMKKIGKLGLSRLKGFEGDIANALLAGAGYNLKLILNFMQDLLQQILWLLLKTSSLKIKFG